MGFFFYGGSCVCVCVFVLFMQRMVSQKENKNPRPQGGVFLIAPFLWVLTKNASSMPSLCRMKIFMV